MVPTAIQIFSATSLRLTDALESCIRNPAWVASQIKDHWVQLSWESRTFLDLEVNIFRWIFLMNHVNTLLGSLAKLGRTL